MAIRLFEQAAHVQVYARFRPTYPKAILDIISGFLSKNNGGFGLAVDVGCGSGQSTFYLSSLFKNCLGTDISEVQVAQAQKKCQELNIKNVGFKVGDATNLPIESGTVDMLSCAQAWHWMEPEGLYREANRVLKPKGCLAIYGYGNPQLTNKGCNELLSHFYYNTLKGCWHEKRKHVENLYREVKLPYQKTERHDFNSSRHMQMSAFIGYVSSWSGYQTYCERHPGNTVLEDMQQNMKRILEATPPADTEEGDLSVEVVFPYFVILGQKE